MEPNKHIEKKVNRFYQLLCLFLLQLNILINPFLDGTQSLHMNGIVPNARSALFEIWREYDDIKIFDVSYYLKLNHSRLVTSSLKWRPELYENIQVT